MEYTDELEGVYGDGEDELQWLNVGNQEGGESIRC
jgi:hypothetical protein